MSLTLLIEKLDHRISNNVRSAASHPDPLVRDYAKVRIDAYRTVLDEVEALVHEAKDENIDLRMKLAAANEKWTTYERDYILPTFRFLDFHASHAMTKTSIMIAPASESRTSVFVSFCSDAPKA